MQPDEVKKLIQADLPDCEVEVSSGDGSHFDVTVVGERFAGMSPVNKQREVYATITDPITSGEIHAVNIKTYTPEEWEKASKLKIS